MFKRFHKLQINKGYASIEYTLVVTAIVSVLIAFFNPSSTAFNSMAGDFDELLDLMSEGASSIAGSTGSTYVQNPLADGEGELPGDGGALGDSGDLGTGGGGEGDYF